MVSQSNAVLCILQVVEQIAKSGQVPRPFFPGRDVNPTLPKRVPYTIPYPSSPGSSDQVVVGPVGG